MKIIKSIYNWWHHNAYGRPASMGSGGHKFTMRGFIIRVLSWHLPCNKWGDRILHFVMDKWKGK